MSAALRAALLALVDEEHSICEVSERLNLFCGGFGHWTFCELKKLYPTIVRSRPSMTQQELKALANRWQLARQELLGRRLACDTKLRGDAHEACRGWDQWSDADLGRLHFELCGEEVEALPDLAL